MAKNITNDNNPPVSRYGSVRRRVEWVAQDQRHKLRQAWIDRILDLLENDNLIALAASNPSAENVLIFECNFAPEVWDDPRIVYRVKQLATNEISVELVEREHKVSDRTFRRIQIHVAF